MEHKSIIVSNKYITCTSSNDPDSNINGHVYDLKIYNGRIKVYIDGYVAFTFNQIDFKGYYAYKDDTDLYGLDIYLMNEKGGATTMEVYFKTKENWLNILKLLDEKL